MQPSVARGSACCAPQARPATILVGEGDGSQRESHSRLIEHEMAVSDIEYAGWALAEREVAAAVCDTAIWNALADRGIEN